MRILLVHNRYRESGGEDAVVHTQLAMLRDAGHDVLLDEVDNPTDPAAALRSFAVSTWNVRQGSRVARLAMEFQPDVVHVHNTWFTLTPTVVRSTRAAGFPVVVTLHNYRLVCVNASLYRAGSVCVDCVGHLPWRGVVRGCYHDSRVQSAGVATAIAVHRGLRTWTSHADVVVVPSTFARRQLEPSGIASDRLTVTPNPVADPGARRQPPSSSRVVLYAGRLSEEKGLPVLVDAWRARPLQGLELVLVGDGELRERYASVGSGVTVLPWLDAETLRSRMLEARAVVVPTRMLETFGLLAVEAMAAGSAVLTTAGGAVAEAVGAAGPAPVPMTAGPSAWSAALHRLTDDAAVDGWGAAARSRYESHYSPDRTLAQTVADYRTAVARRNALAGLP